MSEKINREIVHILLDPERCDYKKLKMELLKKVLEERSIDFHINSSLQKLQFLYSQHILPKSHNSYSNNRFLHTDIDSFHNNKTSQRFQNNNLLKWTQLCSDSKSVTSKTETMQNNDGDDLLRVDEKSISHCCVGGSDEKVEYGSNGSACNPAIQKTIKPIVFKKFHVDGIQINNQSNNIISNKSLNNSICIGPKRTADQCVSNEDSSKSIKKFKTITFP